ncbi:Peroxisomal membrane protein 11A [Nymphaea thermarum]|nr:Peroxisomal membrane protein 11A [Nymphaea thermarum]
MERKPQHDVLQSDSRPREKRKKKEESRRDLTDHLEAYLARRDGVDKLLKISRYAAKLALASSLTAGRPDLHRRLKSFDSSVGVSRKAFRLGKFVQDLNALKRTRLDSGKGVLGLIAYGGEGAYYFVEQFVWLAKAGLIDGRRAAGFQKVSAWAELVGYIGSVALKVLDLRTILDEAARLETTVKALRADGRAVENEAGELQKLQAKAMLKQLSIVQDIADALMAIGDLQDGKGFLSSPIVIASAGLLSALISTHKNWTSC